MGDEGSKGHVSGGSSRNGSRISERETETMVRDSWKGKVVDA